jgi:hypothetical protein
MVSCPSSYELYVTSKLTNNWREQQWAGSITKAAQAATLSHELTEGRDGRIVWIE